MLVAPPNTLIVKEEKAPTATLGGVELPEKVDRPYHTGIVVDGFMWPPKHDGIFPLDIRDKTVYYRGGFSFTHDGEEYMHVSQHDIIAVADAPKPLLAVE